ncbi:aminotransferase class I/II-fold pyridoxal phosphate-dependent enzyme [Novosphingobium sp. JCM 18896]|uniref:aminotransferase class I/II-fold pyridoxal phosphate-dependent enzyme n=1 Tax=Novosphingobium sp. JCM 18896 TaxID=2989731 RepID=UPI002223EC6C|nr:aminotransferase class I/II-fold pyridoxal phosphate-dependent enzyme [Novosphingobium sp. JCM 18896]MCW1428245.1 aminotransferase class I/II-fold pyridoxal phosphate-dependent enzyme [Novosphingobium sp. JCM 18896]
MKTDPIGSQTHGSQIRAGDISLSRRAIMRGTGAAVALPLLAQAAPLLAQRSAARPVPEDPAAMIASLTDGVYINSNESPLGPCPAARQALAGIERLGGRYGMAFANRLADVFARQNGLAHENVVVHPGSYAPLCAAGLAFSSKARPIAYFEPTFDSGFMGAGGKPVTRTVTLPLGGDFQMDMRKLLAAAPDAGLYYVCNPNNPTGLVTPREQIEWLLANKPAGSVVLVDEAYIHYSEAQSCLDLVAKGQDVVVLRTFSKIYGLAGLRVGVVAARKDLLDRLADYGINVTPMPAVIAAEASLLTPDLVPERKAYNTAVRNDLFAWLHARGTRYLPSQTSFVMIEVGRPGGEIATKLAADRVFISGARKHMDNWVRISMGTPAEMKLFKAAFAKALA